MKTVSAYTHNRYLYISRQHNIFFIFNGRTRYEKRSSESKHLIKNGTKNDRLQVRHCVWGGGCQTKKGNKFATNEAILAKDIKISGRIRNLNVLPTRVRFQIRKKALQ